MKNVFIKKSSVKMGKIKDGRNLNRNGNSISKFKLYNKQIFDI